MACKCKQNGFGHNCICGQMGTSPGRSKYCAAAFGNFGDDGDDSSDDSGGDDSSSDDSGDSSSSDDSGSQPDVNLADTDVSVDTSTDTSTDTSGTDTTDQTDLANEEATQEADQEAAATAVDSVDTSDTVTVTNADPSDTVDQDTLDSTTSGANAAAASGGAAGSSSFLDSALGKMTQNLAAAYVAKMITQSGLNPTVKSQLQGYIKNPSTIPGIKTGKTPSFAISKNMTTYLLIGGAVLAAGFLLLMLTSKPKQAVAVST